MRFPSVSILIQIRVSVSPPGNEQVWRREAKREWDKYNFGIFGCWTMDENGNLDYIHEEDYSEEIWNEQKKQGMRMMQR